MSDQNHLEEVPRMNIFKKPPAHCVVPGTNFTVDWHCRTSPNYVHSFLSHAHEDHLAGIRSFGPPRILHCTEMTAKMLLIKVPKVAPCIQTCKPNTTFVVDKVKIHVLNANHTPGSAIFIFELPSGRKILHTGDFRAEPSVIESARPYAPIDNLYIDCTFATSGLTLPPRSVCTQFVIERIKAHMTPNMVVMIGTYTIGKEDLVLDVAQALGVKVYAPPKRLDGIKGLMETGWRKSDCFTDDPSAIIHLMPIQNCGSDEALRYGMSIGRTQVISFRVTGWAGKPFWQTPETCESDNISVYAYMVPYSDHSAPSELLDFIKVVQPTKIVSTTQTSEKDIAKIQKMYMHLLRKEKNKSFIEFYAKPVEKEKIIPIAADDSQCFSANILEHKQKFLSSDTDEDVEEIFVSNAVNS